MLANYVFSAEKTGKKLLLLGSVHGDEICGNRVIERLREKIMSGELALEAGKITAIPIANERAFRQQVRYTEANLNRSFYWSGDGHFSRKYGECLESLNSEQVDFREKTNLKAQEPMNYEERRAKELAQFFINQDAEIDIHSQTVEGEPYCFAQNNSPELLEYLEALGTENIILDWVKVYPEGDFSSENLAEKMGVLGTTIECGSHNNPESTEYGWGIILRALPYLGIISQDSFQEQLSQMPEKYQAKNSSQKVRITKMYRWTGGQMSRDWQHLEKVAEGTLLAVRSGGEEIRADKDCLVILPNFHPQYDNQEWFYLAEPVSFSH